MTLSRLLSIAGSDSGGGAGLQADLLTFAAHGAYGLSALTAVTAQDTRAVHATHRLPPSLVAAQIDAAFGDIGVDAVKTGMLGSAEITQLVADRLAFLFRARRLPLVVDPVLEATAGPALLDDDAIPILLNHLLPLSTVVTPNLPELESLTGLPITDEPARLAAARALARRGPAVLAKGGHAAGPELVDLLIVGEEVHRFVHPRQATRAGHGTGCTLSASLTAHLAAGESLPQAAAAAIAYVQSALAAAPGLGRGRGPLGHPPA